MNLTISGHHLEVTPALRTYVTGKLDRITRHFDQVVDVKVLLTVEKQKEKEDREQERERRDKERERREKEMKVQMLTFNEQFRQMQIFLF